MDLNTQTVNTATEVAPVTPVQAPVVTPKEDLVTRASKVVLDKPTEAVKPAEDSIKLDQATIDKIADPVLKASVQEAYKSMQADYTRKTQDLASKRKELEASGQYTPERIQSMLNDPTFVQAAQEYQKRFGTPPPQASNANAELTEEEFSYLQPEQQKLYLKTKQMEQSLNIVNTRLQASEVEKQDISLRSKYGEHYKPETVNQIYNDMMSGKLQATREHLFRVADYEDYGKRCYQLGQSDKKESMGEKFNASSTTNGVSVTPSGDVPVKMATESGGEYFKRIAAHNFAKLIKR